MINVSFSGATEGPADILQITRENQVGGSDWYEDAYESDRSEPDEEWETCDLRSEEHQQLIAEQRSDSGWLPLIKYLEGTEGIASARLVRKSADYGVLNGILHKRVETESGPRMVIVVPSKMRAMVLYKSHDLPTSGHQGKFKTERRIRQRFHWNSIRSDVKDYVDSCVVCKTNKATTQRPAGLLNPLDPVRSPLDRVAIDKVGGIQNSANGYHYIYAIVDYCTRFAYAEPAKDATAETALRIMRRYMTIFGVPQEVLTDNGGEFKGVFDEAVRKVTKLTHPTPRHPQTNGMVERLNRSLSESIRMQILDPRHSDWDQRLPGAVYAYNSGVHKVTRFTPFFLMYGRDPTDPSRAVPGLPEPQRKETVSLTAAWDTARVRTTIHQQKEKARYDRTRREIVFKPGDLVVVDRSIMKKGRSHRFNKRRDGPYEISRVFDNNTVELKGARGSARVNIDRCHLLPARPRYLEYRIGADTEQADPSPQDKDAGDTLSHPLTEEEQSEMVEDESLDNIGPIRRSLRTVRPPSRLIETMQVEAIQSELPSPLCHPAVAALVESARAAHTDH